MKNRVLKTLMVALIIVLGLFLWSKASAQHDWKSIDVGISKTVVGEDVWVYRINQKINAFVGRGDYIDSKPITEWLGPSAGAINLNMFTSSEKGATPVGYTKINNEEIQPILREKSFNAFICWDKDTLVILDRYRDGMDKIMSYPNVSQNIRMIVEDGKRNRWQPQNKKWSVSTLATSKEGYVYFIHSRHPYTMHDFIEMLLNTDLNIHRMAYLEGGPESQVIVYGHTRRPPRGWLLKQKRHGSYETGYVEHDEINTFWEIPWVLAFYGTW